MHHSNQCLYAISVFVVIILAGSGLQAQSPWTPKQGHGYAQLSFNAIHQYNSLFLSDGGKLLLKRQLSDYTIQAYGEYGLTDRTAIIGAVPLKVLRSGEAQNGLSPSTQSGSLSALGNIEAGIRHNFISKGAVFSGQLTVEAATSAYQDATGLRSGYDAWAFVPSLSLGQGTGKLYGYVSVGTGFRTSGYSSDFRLNAEGGYKFFSKWWIVAVLNLRESYQNGNVALPANNRQTGLYVNNQSYFAYGVKTIIEITPKFGVNGAFYVAGGGNFVAESPSVNLGVYVKW